MRDLLAHKFHVVVVLDVYGTASIAGSIMICLCWRFGAMDLAPIIGALVVIILRVLAVQFKWQLYRPVK